MIKLYLYLFNSWDIKQQNCGKEKITSFSHTRWSYMQKSYYLIFYMIQFSIPAIIGRFNQVTIVLAPIAHFHLEKFLNIPILFVCEWVAYYLLHLLHLLQDSTMSFVDALPAFWHWMAWRLKNIILKFVLNNMQIIFIKKILIKTLLIKKIF